MRQGTCPKCRGDNVRKVNSLYQSLFQPGHSSVILLGMFRYTRLAHYFCGHCGFHESYVEIPGDLAAVVECSERVAVTAKSPGSE